MKRFGDTKKAKKMKEKSGIIQNNDYSRSTTTVDSE